MVDSRPSEPSPRLSVIGVLARALVLICRNPKVFRDVLWPPAVAIIVLLFAAFYLNDYLSAFTNWVLALAYSTLVVLLAVSCHRLVLLGPGSREPGARLRWSMRETRFAAWVLGIWVVYVVCWMTVILVVLNIAPSLFLRTSPGGSAEPFGMSLGRVGWPELLGTIPASYLYARLVLVLPATAIDRRPTVRWAWNCSRRNGWRLLVVVGVLPIATSYLLYAVYREGASVVESAWWYVLFVILLIAEIAVLSVSYQDLTGTRKSFDE